MKPPFILSNRAKEDLKEIARFTQKRWGRAQRNSYLAMLDDTFHRLAENPAIGMDCSDIRPGYRKFPAGSHTIFYRNLDNAPLQIVRILHQSMDVAPQLTLEDNQNGQA